VALTFCWAVMVGPAGKRMAPFLPELVARLRACGELEISEETAAKLCTISAATIDRRMAGERTKLQLKGRSGTMPGSLLKSQIPIRTWAGWDDAVPGFVEVDLVGHEGGNGKGTFCQTLTVTDIATGWTETRAVRSKAQARVLAALNAIIKAMPFPVLGIDSDNGAEFINHQLLRFCVEQTKRAECARDSERPAISCPAPVSLFPPGECYEPCSHCGERGGGKDDDARREEHCLQGCRRNKDCAEARPCCQGYLKVRHIHR
jgi:hypothetical protein